VGKGEGKKQIPFGDDDQKGKGNGKGKNNRRSFDSVVRKVRERVRSG
jgi:hypothetical protein